MYAKLKSFILTAILFGVLLAVNAQSAPDSLSRTMAARLSGKWYLVPVLTSDTSTGRIPEIYFDIQSGRMSGSTGCNRMSGAFLATDTSLHFSDKMITTRMACMGYNEEVFLKNLLRVDGYEFKKGLLILTIGGVEISQWSRQIIRPKKTATT